MKIKLFFLILITALLSSGCYDKTELEKRGFIGAFSIDLKDDEIALGVEFLALKSDKPEETNERDIKQISRENLSESMRGLNEQSSKVLSFGLSKACLLGEELLSNPDKLLEVVNALKKNSEISDKLIIHAVNGEASDNLKNGIRGENALGYYIANYYQHARNKAPSALLVELETLAGDLRDGNGVLLPLFAYNEDEKSPEFSGAAMVKDGLIGYASKDELKGIAWTKGLGRDQILSVETDVGLAVIRITDQSVRFNFHEENSGVVCTIGIRAEGELLEFIPDMDANELEKLFAMIIANEVNQTHEFLHEHGIDGYHLNERLYKRYPNIYEEHKGEKYILNTEAVITISH